MALIVKDRVQETCSAPGTGTVSLLGAVTGFQTFSSAIGNTNTTFYTIADQTGANWEVGIGTYATAGNTLARTTVLASSNGGSLTNFSSGTQNIWGDYPAGYAVYASNNPGTSGYYLKSNGSGVAPIWVALPTDAITQTEQTATAGQTVFTVSYTVGLLVVFQNGAKLGAADFTATNGTSVTLTTGAVAGDLLTFQAFAPYSLASATGTGLAVLQTSPTLVTPNLGTPSAGVLTNCTSFPAAQGSSMVLLGYAAASNSASIDFTGLVPGSYSSYRVIIDCAVPVNNAVNLLMRVSSGGVFQTASYWWQNWRWTTAGQATTGQAGTATGIALDAAGADNIANVANNGGNWIIDIMCPWQASDIHKINYQGYYLGSTWLGVVGNAWTGTNTIDGLRFLMDSGNISTGRFWVYGIKNA